MYVEDHVASGVAYRGVWVCGGIVDKPQGVRVFFYVPFDCCVAMESRAVSIVGSTAIE